MNYAMSISQAPHPRHARILSRTAAPLADRDRDWLRDLVFDVGDTAAARFVGLSRNTLARACAGLGCYPGTHALVREARARHR